MDKRQPEDLTHDVVAGAPNSVTWNKRESDAKFWSGKRGLNGVQFLGIVLILVTMAGVFWNAVYWKLWASSARGTPVERLIANFGDWIILFVIFGVLFLLLRWRVRRALLTSAEQTQNRDMN